MFLYLIIKPIHYLIESYLNDPLSTFQIEFTNKWYPLLLGVPILADEPDLRLISLQHNSIKRIQNLDTAFRLVFLDLYHNRLEQVFHTLKKIISFSRDFL